MPENVLVNMRTENGLQQETKGTWCACDEVYNN